ncbi:hypothetical protein K1719_000674 [Acacia pycnantha]|nr:hypothetical protein K1719_000674 [Acacia pycnantha]
MSKVLHFATDTSSITKRRQSCSVPSRVRRSLPVSTVSSLSVPAPVFVDSALSIPTVRYLCHAPSLSGARLSDTPSRASPSLLSPCYAPPSLHPPLSAPVSVALVSREPSEEEFCLAIRNGLILCNVLNKGASMSKVVDFILCLKGYYKWKLAGGIGEWRYGGTVRITSFPKGSSSSITVGEGTDVSLDELSHLNMNNY